MSAVLCIILQIRYVNKASAYISQVRYFL